MAIFSTAKGSLRIVGILAISEEKLPLQLRKYQAAINNVHIFVVLAWIGCYLCSALYFALFEAKTFGQYFNSGLYCVLNALRIVVYIICRSNIKKLSNLWDDLETIINKQSQFNPEIRSMYEEQIVGCEKTSIKFRRFMMTSAIISVLPKFLTSIYRYFAFDLSDKTFELLMLMTIPWNWKSPIGYFAAAVVQFSWLYLGIFIIVSAMLSFAGCCTVFVAFTTDIQRKLAALNDALSDAEQNSPIKNRIEFNQRFSEIFAFHSIAQQSTDRYSTLYGSIIFIMFGLSSIALCASLLGLNAAIQLHATVDIVRTIFFIAIQTLYVGFFCHFGHAVTMGFEEVDYSIYQCGWEKFPVNIQKMLIMTMMMSQKPVYLQGVMNTQCSREVFQKIVKLAFSYFSMMRSVDG